MTRLLASIFFIGAFSAIAFSACDFSTAICNSAGITCPSSPTFQLKNDTYGLTPLDVISFNDLTITHGDIEGRVAIRNNFYGSNGISVGDKLTDGLGYSLIVGGNLNFANDGAVYPFDKNFFVGGSVSGPSYLTAADNCSSLGASTGCLNNNFDAAFNYWSQFSSLLASQNDNMNVRYQDQYAILSCNATVGTYFISLSPSEFSQTVGWCTVGCPSGANYVINVIGGDVFIGGNTLQVSGNVIYNIGGGSITISTSVYGNIVAPSSNIIMTGGTIYGSAIGGNFSNIVQVNLINTCPGTVFQRRDDYCSILIGNSTGSASGSVSGSASGSVSGSASASGSDASSSASASGSVSGSASGSDASSSASASTSASDSGSTPAPIEGGSTASDNNDGVTSSSSAVFASAVLIAIAALI